MRAVTFPSGVSVAKGLKTFFKIKRHSSTDFGRIH